MRWVICAVVVLALPSSAFAGDFDILRGTVPTTDWSGFYVGGQGAYASGGANFAQATGPLISYLLRNTAVEQNFNVSGWQVLGKEDSSTTGFGGFAGYNSQWSDVVLGLEANYTHASWSASSTDSLARRMDSGSAGSTGSAGGTTYNVAVDGTSSIRLKDYGSLRARAGYVTGSFMPYAFVGFVVGRADIAKSVTVTETEFSDSTGQQTGCLGLLPSCSLTDSDSRANQFIYGYSAGLGLDMALTQNIFLRGEYEYIQFVGLGGMNLYLNTLRVGGGLKF
jgi:outer membrane immunogenic protein